MSNKNSEFVIDTIVERIELPDTAYEKARNRYEDLGSWFDRDNSKLSDNNPHIFPQGSFRLGTAIRPLDESEEYDLDLACKLREGISKGSHTQAALKNLVGDELEAYRKARGIKNKLKEKHRCWRLEYQDGLSFHMDIVPCIPSDERLQKAMMESILNGGLDRMIATEASRTTVSITDNRLRNYSTISHEWSVSNPEGYALWFESRMNPRDGRVLLEKAQVDDVPLFRRKMPLQKSVQFLKRHRDHWARSNPDSKPISIILTTLAARAYHGEKDIVSALGNILERMGNMVQPTKPRVPNPVDPAEDFADRWHRRDCSHLRLEENFNSWLMQARADFANLTSTDDTAFLCKLIENRFSLRLDETDLKALRIGPASGSARTPKGHTIAAQDPPRPWKE